MSTVNVASLERAKFAAGNGIASDFQYAIMIIMHGKYNRWC
ncbi:hypothetical protein OLP40_01195 [Campylobacter jejuni]|nr:hypothetical protein [Campylobacter jejuni]